MLDHVSINFDQSSIWVLNIILSLMMFGASMSLVKEDFKRVVKVPKATFVGLVSQFLLLPFFTYLMVTTLNVERGLALGMILVAACPGGSFSNIMVWLAKGNLALSVSMTAISSTAAIIMTPFNFSLYASLLSAADTQQAITVDAFNILSLVLVVLVIPLFLGMGFGQKYGALATKAQPIFRRGSLAVFMLFVAMGFSSNFEVFAEHFLTFMGLVIMQNILALITGYGAAKLIGVDERDQRAITLEVGIQNSGLALAILFTFYPDEGSMIIVAAAWGVWHLISGTSLAMWWSRHATKEA